MFTTVFYVIYIIGYTCQTVVTKAGQAVLTNNPKQRPIFAGFDSVLTQMASALVPMLITTILAEKYSVGEFAGDKSCHVEGGGCHSCGDILCVYHPCHHRNQRKGPA